jgi:hypothetical protein
MPTTGRSSAAAMEPRQRMFSRGAVVRRGYDMPLPIPGLIALEMVERLRPTSRERSMIPMPRIEPVVDVPMEPGRPVEPRPRSEKHTTDKPIRAIVSIRCAIIRRIVEVPIWAHRRNADPDNNL